jgi:cleavage stimulation factor subunit 2
MIQNFHDRFAWATHRDDGRVVEEIEMGEKHDVFVGNLSYNTTQEHLQEIFSKVGTVASIRVVTDKDTGRPRGFAFVEYDDAATALSAIRNLDGYDINGRKVCVRCLLFCVS